MAPDQVGTMPLARPASAVAGAPHPAVARIHELDGLRGLLALLVVGYHLNAPLAALHDWLAAHVTLLTQAWYAVDVFFLMSGFVMMHVYGRVFAQGRMWPAFVQFMRARLARLYPVHLAAMAVMLLAMLPFLLHTTGFVAWEGRYSLGAFAASLLMLHGPWLDYRSWNYPAWSISAEWHAYLLFPLLWEAARRLAGSRAACLLALCCLIPFALYVRGGQDGSPEPYPTNGAVLLLRVLPLFFGGMLLHRLYQSAGASTCLTRLSGWRAWTPVLATLTLLWSTPLAPLAVLLAPWLILAALSPNRVRSALRARPLLLLGKISYSLYMTHALVEVFFITVSLKAVHKLAGIDLGTRLGASGALWLAGIALSVLLGYLTWRWVEEPGRRWLMRKTAPAAC